MIDEQGDQGCFRGVCCCLFCFPCIMVGKCCARYESARKKASLEWLDCLLTDLQDFEVSKKTICWATDLQD